MYSRKGYKNVYNVDIGVDRSVAPIIFRAVCWTNVFQNQKKKQLIKKVLSDMYRTRLNLT